MATLPPASERDMATNRHKMGWTTDGRSATFHEYYGRETAALKPIRILCRWRQMDDRHPFAAFPWRGSYRLRNQRVIMNPILYRSP